MLDAADIYRENIRNPNENRNLKRSSSWSLTNGYESNGYKYIFIYFISKTFSIIVDLGLYPRRVIGSKPFYSLTFDLRLYDKDFEYLCNGPNPGFQIFLHSPSDPPKFWTNSLKLPLDRHFILYVKPQVTNTSQKLVKYPSEK